MVFSVCAFAQTPQYYNFNNGTVNNSFPLNQAAGKMSQTVVPAGTFGTPTPAPAGNITKLYFRIAATYPLGPATYSQFRIMLQHVPSEFVTAGSFITGAWDTVYKRDTVTLAAAVSTWLEFTLDHPFAYNPAQPLAISMEQCGATGTVTGFSLTFSTATGSRRIYSVGGCPYVYSGVSTNIINCGVDISTAPAITLPDLLYYKFENNPTPTSTPNFAVPGAGNPVVTLTSLTLASGGQFDTCLSGTATASAKIVTGYNLSTGTSSFTISMWLSELVTPASTRYLFGDAGLSFRCFVGGVAPTGGAVLRGTGVTDVPINGIFPGPNVIHIVYDSASSKVKVYKNGVFQNEVSQTPFNFTAGTGFSVGGYSSSAGLEGKMDEFRFYKRALDSAEIANTWNANLGVITGINPVALNTPDKYSLSQNYPNPFNPVTKINFALPKSGLVTLKVYDMLGREVSTLVNEVKTAGSYTVNFNASNFSSGAYFYRLESNGFIDTKKMMVIK
ncbi:MAG: T9SS type A sorting domain-containing protein [Ignavibacteria bacterium]|nr:T9SS type A sorting domain-containing protein [Ignavibacteria bacterium]